MGRCTYLYKSRHGVFYFRTVLPAEVRACLGIRSREVRVSLRTKDRAKAKHLVAKRAFVMSYFFNELAPWEQDAERRKALYWHGLKMCERFGEVDLNDEFERGALIDEIGGFDLEAYIFTHEHKQRRQAGVGDCEASCAEAVPTPEAPPSATRAGSLKVASPIPASERASPKRAERNVSLQVALDRFYAAKVGANQPTRQATAKKYVDQVSLFVKVVFGGKSTESLISDVTEDVIRVFADLLPTLPPRIRLADPRPIAEIIAATTERMAPKTRFSLARAVVMFLLWCQRQGYPTPSGVEDILHDFLKKPKRRKADKEKSAYTPEEMKALLESDEYRNGTFKRPSDYFAPWIAPYTGACEAEILQLRPTDVYQDKATGIWVMDINEEDGKQTKTENRIRIVPIHRQLIALGWLDYVASIKSVGGTVLFPEDHADDRGGFPGFSKRFNRYRLAKGVGKRGERFKNFHSFRHTFQRQFYDKGVDSYIVKALVGHSQAGEGEGLKTYADGPDLETLNKALHEFVAYDLNFSAVKPNGWIKTRLPKRRAPRTNARPQGVRG